MQQRLVALLALAGFGLLILFGLGRTGRYGGAEAPSGHIAFQIATGGSGGTYFAVGQDVAGLVSHPLGVGRCETSTVCGPSGVILSTRTSQGAFDNLRSVNDGLVDSGFVQGDVVATAIKGAGEFRRYGIQKHVRIIAALFPEELHLVAATKSGIASVADLRGKRVFLGARGSGAAVTSREVLAAWRVPENSLRRADGDDGAALLAAGKIDAFFAIAGVPVESVAALLRQGKGRLVPIDGPNVERLTRRVPQLMPATIAAGVYPGTPAVATVASRAFWIVRDSAPDALVYGITRALFNPANRGALAASHPSARAIGLAGAALDLPAPLHPGAARYYREVGAQH